MRGPHLCLSIALALLPGCSAIEALLDQGRTPIVYVDIVDTVSAQQSLKVPRAALERGARAAMQDWSDFAFREAQAGEEKWQLDLRVGLVTERRADPDKARAPDADVVHRALGLTLKLHALGATERVPSDVQVSALVTRDEARQVPLEKLAEHAVVEAGQRMQTAMELYWGPESAVSAGLSSQVEWQRGMSADAAGVRALKSAVPALMNMVQNKDEAPELVVKAVGALLAIGDPRAAPAIIDACRHQSPQYVVQMLFALGVLGGRQAQGYLFTVQSGHPDPAVRQAAASALEELERRRDPAPAAP